MKALTMNAAAIMFAIVMLSSCGKESLVPITDVAESSSFLSASSQDARQSDHTHTKYDESEPKTHANSQMSAYNMDGSALQSDKVQTDYSEEPAKTSADAKLRVKNDINPRQSDKKQSADSSEGTTTASTSNYNENTSSRTWIEREKMEKEFAKNHDPAKTAGSDDPQVTWPKGIQSKKESKRK